MLGSFFCVKYLKQNFNINKFHVFPQEKSLIYYCIYQKKKKVLNNRGNSGASGASGAEAVNQFWKFWSSSFKYEHCSSLYSQTQHSNQHQCTMLSVTL